MLINLSTKAPPVPFGGGKKGARSVVTEAFYALDDVEDMTFIDFFGGSGLLSQWALEARFKKVVYNDFDDYLGRIRYSNTKSYIEFANWLSWFFYEACGLEQRVRCPEELAEFVRKRMLDEFARCDEDGLDPNVFEYPLLQPVAFQTRPYDADVRVNRNAIIYTAARTGKTRPTGKDWCKGSVVESTDYRELLNKYEINSDTLCSIDPPYPDTLQFAYTGGVTLDDIADLVKRCVDKGAKVMVYGNKQSGIYDTITKNFPSIGVYEFLLQTHNKDGVDYLFRNF